MALLAISGGYTFARAARARVERLRRRPSVDGAPSRGGFRGGCLDFGALLAHGAAAGAIRCALRAARRSGAIDGHATNGDKKRS